MAMVLSALLGFLLTLPSLTQGYGTGVPVNDKICESMVPGHYGTQSESLETVPYEIRLETTCYQADQNIKGRMYSYLTMCSPFEWCTPKSLKGQSYLYLHVKSLSHILQYVPAISIVI